MALVEFPLGLRQHAGGEVDAGDVDAVGVIFKGKARADADVEDPVIGTKWHCVEGFGEAAFEEDFKAIVEAAVEVIDAGSDGFGHCWRSGRRAPVG